MYLSSSNKTSIFFRLYGDLDRSYLLKPIYIKTFPNSWYPLHQGCKLHFIMGCILIALKGPVVFVRKTRCPEYPTIRCQESSTLLFITVHPPCSRNKLGVELGNKVQGLQEDHRRAVVSCPESAECRDQGRHREVQDL